MHWRGTSRDLLRTTALPDGFDFLGWHVPRLLNPEGAPLVGYFDEAGFQIPEPYRSVVERLQALWDYQGPVLAEHARLAADLLALNFHVSLSELALLKMTTPAAVWGFIQCGGGLHPSHHRALG